jgi:hypothetical protein
MRDLPSLNPACGGNRGDQSTTAAALSGAFAQIGVPAGGDGNKNVTRAGPEPLRLSGRPIILHAE